MGEGVILNKTFKLILGKKIGVEWQKTTDLMNHCTCVNYHYKHVIVSSRSLSGFIRTNSKFCHRIYNMSCCISMVLSTNFHLRALTLLLICDLHHR